MNREGRIIDANTVRFERLLPGPIELAWDFLTKPGLVATWFASIRMEPRVGGMLEIRFTLTGDEDCDAAGTRGEIRAFEPPRLFAFTWQPRKRKPGGEIEIVDEGEVRFELTPQDGKVLLTLTHARIPPGETPGYAGGWHAYLDNLESRIGGDVGVDLFAAYRRLEPGYDANVAQATRQGDAE